MKYPGLIWRMANTPNQLHRGPVQLGQDNEYVYRELLGVSDEQYRRFEEAGHIGSDYIESII
jgi:crotonobetainyl-CoA:carnitine CoA-transferase CaiB-like acyl-CoA transferase